MRKIILMVGVLLTLTAGMALAAGSIALNWTACRTGATHIPNPAVPTTNRSPLCTSTGGASLLIASFVAPPETSAGLDGMEAIIDYQTADGVAANCWWNFTGALRSASLTVKPVDPGDVNIDPVWGCDSYMLSKGTAAGGGGMGLLGNGNGRIACATGIPAGTGTAPNGNENSCVGVTIGNQATGAGCPGCLVQACLTLNRIVFQITNGPKIEVNVPTVPNGNVVTWQTGFAGCQGATPARKATWGSVKALYR